MPPSTDSVLDLLKNEILSEDVCPIIAAELESGVIKVVDVVEGLGGWLTNQDVEKRAVGTRVLSVVLSLLPSELLPPPECSLLTAFLADRLNDHYTVLPPAISALASLTNMDNFPDSGIPDILMGLQKTVICQTLTASTRLTFYKIFYNMFVKKRDKVLAAFGSDFLFGLVTGMASEADPRNLVFLFSFLPSVLSSIPLKNLKEETFAVLESYFPVDYNPGKDNDEISREALARGLESCLVASPELAELCLPMICEKLDTTLLLAQSDALHLLKRGAIRWGLEGLSSSGLDEVWSALRPLLLPTGASSSPPELNGLAGQALSALLTAFSSAPLSQAQSEAFSRLLHSILASSDDYLRDPSTSLFLPAMRLLSGAGAVSHLTALFFLPKVIPQILALLESETAPGHKETALKALQPFLTTAANFQLWNNEDCELGVSRLLEILVPLLKTPQTAGAALANLSLLHSHTDPTLRAAVFQTVHSLAATSSSKIIRTECAKFVRLMAKEYPEEVDSLLIRPIIAPDFPWSGEAECERLIEILTWTLEAEPLTLSTARALLRLLSPDTKRSEVRAATLRTLRRYAESGRQEMLSCLGNLGFPLRLIESYLERSASAEEESTDAALLCTAILRALPVWEQKCVMLEGLNLLSVLIFEPEVCPTSELVLLEGLLAGLRPEVEIPNSQSVYDSLFHFALNATTGQAQTSAARLLAILINKSEKDEELIGVVDKSEALIGHPQTSLALGLTAWLTKALVLRGHQAASRCLEKLLKLTLDPTVGTEAASGVQLVLADSLFFTTSNFCRVGLLYKQRVFEKLDLLLERRDEERLSRGGCLALAHILHASPTPLIASRIHKLVRVMVECLTDGDDVVSNSVLEVISRLLQEKVCLLAAFSQDFIPIFLRLAASSPFMKVRIQALDCLYLFGESKTEDIIIYKKMVVNELQKCLDDRKRLVRQAAVKARSRWCLL